MGEHSTNDQRSNNGNEEISFEGQRIDEYRHPDHSVAQVGPVLKNIIKSRTVVFIDHQK
jgi:hypothetical protein